MPPYTSLISRARRYLVPASVVAAVLIIAIGIASSAPGDAPTDAIITVSNGATLNSVADDLKSAHIIRSTILYRIYATILEGTAGVKSGHYLFDGPQSSLRVAYRTTHGLQGFPLVRITIPEGLASSDIARAMKRAIPAFDSKAFMALAKKQEGYLFPDTYFFEANVTPEQVVSEMRANFDRRTARISSAPWSLGGRTFRDVIAMSSLVEDEAATSTDRRIVAGILWKRLDIGMALQVDAPFFYLFGKSSAQLTLSDLATTSPYNLYKNRGLPPTPINNPGLEAITDTMNPLKTDYLYFMSGRDGTMHYAATLEQHNANKAKYLN